MVAFIGFAMMELVGANFLSRNDGDFVANEKQCNCLHAYQQCSVSRNCHTLNSVLIRTSEQNDDCTDIVARWQKTWLWLYMFRMQRDQHWFLLPRPSSSNFMIVNSTNKVILREDSSLLRNNTTISPHDNDDTSTYNTRPASRTRRTLPLQLSNCHDISSPQLQGSHHHSHNLYYYHITSHYMPVLHYYPLIPPSHPSQLIHPPLHSSELFLILFLFFCYRAFHRSIIHDDSPKP